MNSSHTPSLTVKSVILGTLLYALTTFPLAYIWHLVAFKSTYEQLGYVSREEPIIAFGFFAILIQGVILSTVFPLLTRWRGAVAFVSMMGLYHWTIHVLAEAAKHKIEPLSTWFLMESLYLLIQFSLAAGVFSLLYRARK